MDAKHLTRLRADLAAFLDELMPDRLGNAARRRWAEVYLRGLLLDGHRKSVEPMAQRLRATDGSARDYAQALQQFLNQSPWGDRPVRDRLARRVVAAVGGLLDPVAEPLQQGPKHGPGVRTVRHHRHAARGASGPGRCGGRLGTLP